MSQIKPVFAYEILTVDQICLFYNSNTGYLILVTVHCLVNYEKGVNILYALTSKRN